MRTLKTAVVIVLLLAVLYGVHMVLNKPDALRALLGKPTTAEDPPELNIGNGTPYDPNDPGGVGQDGDPLYQPDHDHGDQKFQVTQDGAAPRTTLPPPGGAFPDSQDRSSAYGAPHDNGTGDSADNRTVSVRPDDLDPRKGQFDPSAGPPSGKVTPITTAEAFNKDWKTALDLVDNRQYRQALETLTVYYGSPDLDSRQQQQLLDLLDPLAARVIYSRQHLLEKPYQVRRGDSLEDVARQYYVPAQLLANINGIANPNALVPGSELKVLRGPFRAQVDTQQGTLTLFLDRLYAGRFHIDVGQQRPTPGEYAVNNKENGWAYYPPRGDPIPARDPANPYGNWWIDLGRDVAIHGSPTSDAAGAAGLGCISLSPRDATDVYGILSKGSKVEILR